MALSTGLLRVCHPKVVLPTWITIVIAAVVVVIASIIAAVITTSIIALVV
jgi:hypothetical protein